MKLLLAALIALASVSPGAHPTLPPDTSESSDACPDGWRSEGPIPGFELACSKLESGWPSVSRGWFLKVASWRIVPHVADDPAREECDEVYQGTPSNPNPAFVERNAGDWLTCLRDQTSNVSAVISGIHFECSEGFCEGQLGDTSPLAYPTWRLLGPNVENLRNTGVTPNLSFNRRCLAMRWEPGEVFRLESYPWTETNHSWAATNAALDEECGESHFPYFGYSWKTVAMHPDDYSPGPDLPDPWPFPVGDYNSRSYIGDEIGSGGQTTCFSVGGWYTNAEMDELFEEFDCIPRAQLDGGPSAQFAYYEPESGQYQYPVKGFGLPFELYPRKLPHVFVIFD